MSHYQKWVTWSPITGIKKWDRDSRLRPIMIHLWELGIFYPKQMNSQGKRVKWLSEDIYELLPHIQIALAGLLKTKPEGLISHNVRGVWIRFNKHLSITFYLPVFTQTLQPKQQTELMLFLPSGSPLYNGRWRPVNSCYNPMWCVSLWGSTHTYGIIKKT